MLPNGTVEVNVSRDSYRTKKQATKPAEPLTHEDLRFWTKATQTDYASFVETKV